MALPAQTFRWRGSGGGEVIGFRIVPGYNARTADLEERIATAIEAADPRHGHAMVFYGVGNHGGGPTRDSVEWILEHRTAFPGVELRFSSPDAFFDAIEPFRDELPLFDDELQHVFPGCYSVMHDIKQRQQRGEHLLDQAGRVLEAFGGEDERGSLAGRVDAAWDDLLFTSFHDILAGTSIPSAWESVRAMQGRALITGEEVVHTTTRRFARSALPAADVQQIVALNADEADWEGIVETEPSLYFDRWGSRWLSDVDGTPIPHQLVQPEAHLITNRVVFPLRIPARSAVQVLIRHEDPPAGSAPAGALRASADELDNGLIRVELCPTGVSPDRRLGSRAAGGRRDRAQPARGWLRHLGAAPGRVRRAGPRALRRRILDGRGARAGARAGAPRRLHRRLAVPLDARGRPRRAPAPDRPRDRVPRTAVRAAAADPAGRSAARMARRAGRRQRRARSNSRWSVRCSAGRASRVTATTRRS